MQVVKYSIIFYSVKENSFVYPVIDWSQVRSHHKEVYQNWKKEKEEIVSHHSWHWTEYLILEPTLEKKFSLKATPAPGTSSKVTLPFCLGL